MVKNTSNAGDLRLDPEPEKFPGGWHETTAVFSLENLMTLESGRLQSIRSQRLDMTEVYVCIHTVL